MRTRSNISEELRRSPLVTGNVVSFTRAKLERDLMRAVDAFSEQPTHENFETLKAARMAIWRAEGQMP